MGYYQEIATGQLGKPALPGITMETSAGRMDLDKPIYTLSIAAEILEVHPRTLMMYEALKLVVPHRTPTKRRRFSQRDLLTLQAIQHLTRGFGLNLNGAKYVIQCLQLLDAHGIARPAPLRDVKIEHVRI
jgi:MerR family transcriptional regulator/heat shock protein HspR